MAIVIDGKKVMKTKGNIKIVPSEAPVFRDEKEIYVFPHSVSRKKRNEVYRIMTNQKNIFKEIGKYVAGTVAGVMALTGVATSAYGNLSISDLKAVEDYAIQHGQKGSLTLNGVNQGPLYVLRNGDYSIQVNEQFIMITKNGDKSYVLYDGQRDGDLDALIVANGRLNKGEAGDLEMNAMFGSNPNTSKIEMDLAGISKQASNSPVNTRKELFYNKNKTVTYNDFEAEASGTFPKDNPTALEMKKFGEGAYERFISKLKDIFGLSQGQ